VARTIAAGFLLAGCYSAGDGVSPPTDRVYFPVGLALTNEAKYLAVVNSDFDLQYNAGTLLTLDVGALQSEWVPAPCNVDSDCAAESVCDSPKPDSSGREYSYTCVAADTADPCRGLGLRDPAERLLFPGRCNYIDPTRDRVLTDSAEIGAFATDAVFVSHPDGEERGRLFIPVRGDATVHWADITPTGEIECGKEFNAHGACDDAHRAGDDPDHENTRELRLSPEPFGIAVDPQGKAVAVTNQTSGRVSLFSNSWQADGLLKLEFEVTGLASRPMSVAALPTPKLADVAGEDYSPGFLVTFRNSPEVDLIRYFSDAGANPERPYASRANLAPITVNSIGSDSRGIAIDDSLRRAAEDDCAKQGLELAAYITCLRRVASTSLDVFIASRAPSSLLVGKTTPAENALQSTELPAFYDTVSLSQGPSRVVTGRVRDIDPDGQVVLEPRVFVSCFDSRRVFVYDPVRRRIDVEIATGRGPHALAVDEVHGWLFVGHFTDSFIGVVSLDRRFSHTYGKMLATVGEPSAPRASK
jgi:hypothetical protein